MAAAVVCRFCNRDVEPINASRLGVTSPIAPPIAIARPVPKATVLDDAFAAEIARVGRMSAVSERAQASLPQRQVQGAEFRLSPAVRRLALVFAVIPSAIVPLVIALHLFGPGQPQIPAEQPAEAKPRQSIVAAPPRPVPRVIPIPTAPVSLPSAFPRATKEKEPPPLEVEEQVEATVDPKESAAVSAVAADLAAIRDDRLRDALRLNALLAQARVCDPLSGRVARALVANTSLIETLSGGGAHISTLSRRLARFAADAQRSGRGAPCEDVVQLALQ